MVNFVWTEDLSVGFAEIDAAHQSLFAMFQDLGTAVQQGQSDKVIKPLLVKLKLYAMNHFADEERLMTQYGFPGLAEHRKFHDSFIERVLDFEFEYLEGRAMLSIDLLRFMRDWIAQHIAKADKAYAIFFARKGLTRL